MAEFVKKTALSYKAVPGGQSDYECTHAILTKAEYDRLYSEIRAAESRERKAKDDADKKVENAKTVANRDIRNIQNATALQIKEVNQKLAAANEEISYQRRLNENVLRINRERANAARKIKPKKEHNGYLIDFSKEYEYRYRVGKEEKRVMLWETIIESPYSVKFSDEQARKQIDSELFNNDNWFIGKIGIDAQWLIGYEKMIAKKEYKENYINKNVVVRQQLRANYSRGYWEIILLHTKPLSNVPDEMMRCNYS